MELLDLVSIQREFDEKHGWLPSEDSPKSLLQMLQEDMIGLCGETGELAGVVKDLGLESRRDTKNLEAAITKRLPDLREELIDAFIYLMRIASYLNVDIEEEYLAKLSKNRERFRQYEEES